MNGLIDFSFRKYQAADKKNVSCFIALELRAEPKRDEIKLNPKKSRSANKRSSEYRTVTPFSKYKLADFWIRNPTSSVEF